MQIGALSKRTGVPNRLLRYYEEQGLLMPERRANGYRDYPEPVVDRVLQIRGLLEAGLPTEIIRDLLPCLNDLKAIHLRQVQPDLLHRLEAERDRLERRIQCLMRNRDAMNRYLEAARRIAASDHR